MLPQPLLVGIPRSNSRALRLLTSMFPFIRCFSYSDGLGDCVHQFYMEGFSNYIGHIGFPGLGSTHLIYQIPLSVCVEPWGKYIHFDADAPILIILKMPKEVSIDVSCIASLYLRIIRRMSLLRPVLLSGWFPGLDLPPSPNVHSLCQLTKLTHTLPISYAVGLPSTAFLTLATQLPLERLRIMRLYCAQLHPEADRRILSMKQTLEACMLQLSSLKA
jgi:hypothetical protein